MTHFTWRIFLGGLVLLSNASCERLTRYQVQGTYYRMGDPVPMGITTFELTETKFLVTIPITGEVALDYEVDGDNLYIGNADGRIQFHQEGHGILRQEGTPGYEGRYIKLKK